MTANDPTTHPDQTPDPEAAKGLRALTADEFSIADSVGGVRGVVEAMAPGLVFVVLFIATRELTPPLVAALSVSVLLVVARLVQRTPITQAFGGLLGVGIGVFWAARSGDPSDYFVPGFWTNGAYLAVLLVTVLVRWPAVGLFVELLRAGFGAPPAPRSRAVDATGATAVAGVDGDDVAPVEPRPAPVWSTAWRDDAALVRRYTLATWLWIAAFGARLAVQLPLYYADEIDLLGTARLVMGIPLWALVLWATWVLIRRPGASAAPTPTHRDL